MMTNPILLRQFGDPAYLAGELTALFTYIGTYDEDKYKSLHLHNEILRKILIVIGENEIEFRTEVARVIRQLGEKNAQKEETTRRTVGTGERREVT